MQGVLPAQIEPLQKCPTGIQGLDEIAEGGLPRGRTTLVCGGAGCGKTMLAMEFIMRGAHEFGEPGVYVAFEETPVELAQNAPRLEPGLPELVERGLVAIDHVQIDRHDIEETGEYDLDGLFIRLDYAINQVNAQRVALDAIEVLFAGLPNHAIVRSELRRLFRWLKDRGVTAIITGERAEGSLTRYGLEEYVADCVILLEYQVSELVSTRRLRVVKYRGSSHGMNEYPFLIDHGGISVLPITSVRLENEVLSERITTGVPQLDEMLGGAGYYRGSTILISGTAGTGKSSLAAAFANASCARGERVLYLALEESPSQIIRNMRSVGIDLQPWVEQGSLRFHASRSTYYGLEMYLVVLNSLVREFAPTIVILDPITNFITVGASFQVKSMLTRLMDLLRARQITMLFTSLHNAENPQDDADASISSLIDTWILLRNLESGGERNRGLYVLKSRGMAHSNQVREFVLSDRGIELIDVYSGTGSVLTGSERQAEEARARAESVGRAQEIERRRRSMERRRQAVQAQVAALTAQLEAEEEELEQLLNVERLRRQADEQARAAITRRRLNIEPEPREDGERR